MAHDIPTTDRQRALAINHVASILNATGHWVEPETCDAIVTAVLDAHATPASTSQPEAGEPVVAYRNPNNRRVLLCRTHGQQWAGVVPVTSSDLPEGGICTFGRLSSYECGRDVLADDADQPGADQ
jgi:hypothetical protein